MSSVSPELVKELAPTGTLRAAINIGNPVLVQTDAAGTPSGVTIDLARELAKRVGVPLETVVIDGAGKSFEAVKAAGCDIGFLAIEPARSHESTQPGRRQCDHHDKQPAGFSLHGHMHLSDCACLDLRTRGEHWAARGILRIAMCMRPRMIAATGRSRRLRCAPFETANVCWADHTPLVPRRAY